MPSLDRITLNGYMPKISAICLILQFQQPAPAQDTTRFISDFLAAALERLQHQVVYDGAYRSIPYPGGDVPDSVGVCTDLVIRAYRSAGVDLQRLVHEDMRRHFGEYPGDWGLERPDHNIDHRRVPNLRTFFRRMGAELPLTHDPRDFIPDDLATWILWGYQPHIGIVLDSLSADGIRPLIAHNIGNGPEVQDCLFDLELTGHYRFLPLEQAAAPRED